MGKSKLKAKDLKKIPFKTDRAKSIAIEIMQKGFKHVSKDEKLAILENVLSSPEDYLEDQSLSKLAESIIGKIKTYSGFAYDLNDQPAQYKIYGKPNIDQNTVNQMEVAMRLPITVKGALMPDAHVGYGLPIGGVLATDNAVIPYGVGLDIGCRMSMTIYDVPDGFIKRYSYQIKTALKEHTHFGIGDTAIQNEEHELLDRPEFNETALLKQLHGKACRQLGSSGSGNHFVEFGTLELNDNNSIGLHAGTYLGILAHSGSRGVGATIAKHYTYIALSQCKLPKGAQHLAWLDLNTEAGQEYWLSMNLAGDFAKACHDVIHRKLAKAFDLKPILKIENHHNFAWKEQVDGREAVVHRKGATPAGLGQLGIIPANMIDAGYIVSGKGDESSLCSASHGAGRKMSRKKANESITGSELRKMLAQHRVDLIGGNRDEAPMAYKNIEPVMESQKSLVAIEGKFYPKIVRMDKK